MNRETVVRLQPVLNLLRGSLELSKRKQVNQWNFAVSIGQLYGCGATEADLTDLLTTGLSQHQIETTYPGTRPRTFAPGNGRLDEKSCFVLSEDGVKVMESAGLQARRVDGLFPIKPRWDANENELRIAGQLVKRFRWHAPNQERLIVAFEEAGWPEKIDDPLPADDQVDSKRRLHDTIKCLNRRHVQNLMRFHGDGTGEGVIWRLSTG